MQEVNERFGTWFAVILVIIIAAVIITIGLFPSSVFDFFTFLSNFDLRERGWNIAAVVWCGIISVYGMFKFFNLIESKQVVLSSSRKEVKVLVSAYVGIFTSAFYYLVIDEISNTFYTLTRQNVLAAVMQLLSIPDKYIRWFFLIPMCALFVYFYARKYLNFKIMIYVTVILLCINTIQMSLGIFDIRQLDYPLKTWVYVTHFIPVYIMQGIGYYYFWKK